MRKRRCRADDHDRGRRDCACHRFGIGAEIAACLLEAGFAGQAFRIGAPPVPIASARSLERQILPDADKLIEDILDNLY